MMTWDEYQATLNNKQAEIKSFSKEAEKRAHKSPHAMYVVIANDQTPVEEIVTRHINNLVETYGQDTVNYVIDMINGTRIAG